VYISSYIDLCIHLSFRSSFHIWGKICLAYFT
jgi:hypothetical protein